MKINAYQKNLKSVKNQNLKLTKSFDFSTVYTLTSTHIEPFQSFNDVQPRISSRKLGEITINHLW